MSLDGSSETLVGMEGTVRGVPDIPINPEVLDETKDFEYFARDRVPELAVELPVFWLDLGRRQEPSEQFFIEAHSCE